MSTKKLIKNSRLIGYFLMRHSAFGHHCFVMIKCGGRKTDFICIPPVVLDRELATAGSRIIFPFLFAIGAEDSGYPPVERVYGQGLATPTSASSE